MLPSAVVDGIIDKADGVPFFVEELTKAVLESGRLGGAAAVSSRAGRLPLAIPETLQDPLMGRLGRHARGKELAQSARSSDGSSHTKFRCHDILGERDLVDALRQLVSTELILLRGAGAEAPTSSNMRWSGMPHTPACSRVNGGCFMPGSRGYWRIVSRRAEAIRKCSRIIGPRPAKSARRPSTA